MSLDPVIVQVGIAADLYGNRDTRIIGCTMYREPASSRHMNDLRGCRSALLRSAHHEVPLQAAIDMMSETGITVKQDRRALARPREYNLAPSRPSFTSRPQILRSASSTEPAVPSRTARGLFAVRRLARHSRNDDNGPSPTPYGARRPPQSPAGGPVPPRWDVHENGEVDVPYQPMWEGPCPRYSAGEHLSRSGGELRGDCVEAVIRRHLCGAHQRAGSAVRRSPAGTRRLVWAAGRAGSAPAPDLRF